MVFLFVIIRGCGFCGDQLLKKKGKKKIDKEKSAVNFVKFIILVALLMHYGWQQMELL